jgi:hypothetical protein
MSYGFNRMGKAGSGHAGNFNAQKAEELWCGDAGIYG